MSPEDDRSTEMSSYTHAHTQPAGQLKADGRISRQSIKSSVCVIWRSDPRRDASVSFSKDKPVVQTPRDPAGLSGSAAEPTQRDKNTEQRARGKGPENRQLPRRNQQEIGPEREQNFWEAQNEHKETRTSTEPRQELDPGQQQRQNIAGKQESHEENKIPEQEKNHWIQVAAVRHSYVCVCVLSMSNPHISLNPTN